MIPNFGNGVNSDFPKKGAAPDLNEPGAEGKEDAGTD